MENNYVEFRNIRKAFVGVQALDGISFRANGGEVCALLGENGAYFPITSVHRDDLEGQGFDVEKISDDDMQNLAEKMADDYCEQLFCIVYLGRRCKMG